MIQPKFCPYCGEEGLEEGSPYGVSKDFLVCSMCFEFFILKNARDIEI